MANALKCDRCKNYFDYSPATKNFIAFGHKDIIGKNFPVKDICPNCIIEFMNWFESPKEAEDKCYIHSMKKQRQWSKLRNPLLGLYIRHGGKVMKIIKQGKTEEELKAKLKKTKRFECKTCGCVFEADADEYIHRTYLNETVYYCKCPNCRVHDAYEVKMREIDKKAEESTYKDIEPKESSKPCYDIGCIYHIGIDRCKLAFPTGTSFEKMLTCPYRMPKPLPNIDLGETSR